MPQLDVASFLPQLVWLAITFAILYLLMAKLALPRISDVLEERVERREGNLTKAEEFQAEAEAAAAEYEKVLADARDSAHMRLMQSADESKNRTDAAIRELDEKLAGDIAVAEEAVSQSRDRALAEATAIAAEAARMAASRLAGIEVDETAAVTAAEAARKVRG